MVNFDVNLSVGRWPFRPLPHAEMPELTAYLRKYGVEGGLVRSAESAFSSDLDAENRQLAERCRNCPGFYPLFTANPFYCYWREWDQVQAAVLYPEFQRFSLLAPETLAMAEFLAGRGTEILAVVVREEDERSQHPLCRIPAVSVAELNGFALKLPSVTIIALNCCGWEIAGFTAPNLYCDTAFVEGFPALDPLTGMLQHERVLFGSHAPFFCATAGISKITALGGKARQAVKNAEKLLLGKLAKF